MTALCVNVAPEMTATSMRIDPPCSQAIERARSTPAGGTVNSLLVSSLTLTHPR